MSDRPPDTCGCADAAAAVASPGNPPGLSSLAYRLGTHDAFKRAMQLAIARQPALASLRTRTDDDPSLALMDAWAMVLDVLSFYQERIANEGYIRTALEQRSILELARAIGYEPGPGVAASALLALTVDETEGSPPAITVETGTKVQSVPGPGELPQVFETIEPLDARSAWNALRPETAERILPATGTKTLFVRGITTNLKPGDGILVVGGERARDPESDRWDFRRVRTATAVPPALPSADPQAGHTRIELDRGLGEKGREPAALAPEVYAFRQRASLFGHNAPDWLMMPKSVKLAFGGDPKSPQWPAFNIAYADSLPRVLKHLYLDSTYPAVTAGGWLVVSAPRRDELCSVVSVTDTARAGFGLTAKTTLVELDGPDLASVAEALREIVVFAASERLDLADAPLSEPISGTTVTLDRKIDGLPDGRLLVLSGEDPATGEIVTDAVTLARSFLRRGRTALVFTTALQHQYARETLTIHGNVAHATHGEAKTEILGSGDGSRPFQAFTLKQAPLTFVSAGTATGRETTLDVRVSGISWTEVPTLLGSGPADRVFVARTNDTGAVTIQFGDGVTGARLPTGSENVTARYRVGSGTAGLVDAGQISLLMSRPLGLAAAINPEPAAGAADAEAPAASRVNAPLTVQTMERIVSLQDYESFARAFAGVAKAQAALIWNGEREIVHVTVAGADGTAVDPASALASNLRTAIEAARHATHAIQIDSYRSVPFDVDAAILVNERYVTADVLAAVRTAIESAFAFATRAFAQGVARSDVMAVIQAVDGVEAVDLNALFQSGSARALRPALPASRARLEDGVVVPAELLLVRADGIVLTEMS